MSNKTPKASVAKTASAPKKYRKLFLNICILGCLMVLAVVLSLHRSAHTLVIGEKSYKYETAATQSEQERGLSYRQSLGKNNAMLFVFQQPAQECFWMKDMNFPLDIIWLDANKQVVHIEQNVSPSTYPNSFCPPVAAKYVVEVNAGSTAGGKLKLGDRISF